MRYPFFALILLGSLACGPLALAQSNLIVEPDFESAPAKNNLPAGGWWLYTGNGEPDVGLDRTHPHGGAASVRLGARASARFALVSAPFAVFPGDELQFQGWVRCEKPAEGISLGTFGLAFRDAAGRVFDRAPVTTEASRAEWTLVSGKATVPANAVKAEMHLSFNRAPGTMWVDDVRAVVANPVSFALAKGAQAWTGPQTVTVRVLNRRATPMQGVVRAVVARKTSEAPVALAPGEERLVEVPIALGGVGAFDYTLSLLEGGATVRTLKGKFRTTAPLLLFPACPCYHLVGDGTGETRIDARVVVNPADRRGLRFSAVLTGLAGEEIETAMTDVGAGDMTGVTLHVPLRVPGAYQVTARLLDAGGKELAKATTAVNVAARGAAEVALGADGFLRIGGKPHLAIGMYSAGRYEEMGRAGFSATHNYGITTGEAAETINPNDAHLQELLDRSWANGMRMMVELPRKAIEKAQWAQVRRRLETFRHHPGLLCWGSEERVARGEAPLANLVALYKLVHDVDPDHPLVLGDTRDVIGKLQVDRRNFFPDDAMDVGIWWWYPIPLHGPDGNGLDGRGTNTGMLQPPPWLTTTLSRKPLWIAIQSYQQPRQEAKFPTPTEYRAMAYLSLISGVKGLWFYTGSGQRDWQGKPAGLLNKMEEGHWDYVQQLVRELRELEPALTAPLAVAGKIERVPAESPVEFAAREHNGGLYLFAANKSTERQSVRFIGSGLTDRKVTLLYEKDVPVMERGAILGEFAPLAVHVYRIE
jgi:hypothetical protein